LFLNIQFFEQLFHSEKQIKINIQQTTQVKKAIRFTIKKTKQSAQNPN